MIELRGFGWRYAGRRAWAVRDVDLRIERGERVLLLGLSGAGKSTLLAALAGLLTEDSGERAGELAVDGRAGILFQDPQTQLVMARCGDDVAFGPENLGVPAAATVSVKTPDPGLRITNGPRTAGRNQTPAIVARIGGNPAKRLSVPAQSRSQA